MNALLSLLYRAMHGESWGDSWSYIDHARASLHRSLMSDDEGNTALTAQIAPEVTEISTINQVMEMPCEIETWGSSSFGDDI